MEGKGFLWVFDYGRGLAKKLSAKMLAISSPLRWSTLNGYFPSQTK